MGSLAEKSQNPKPSDRSLRHPRDNGIWAGPIALFAWFLGEQVSSTHAVLPGRFLFRGATKAVEVGGYAYVLESQAAQERDQLCLRQSAGDSTSPQIDVAANVFAEFRIEHDIRKL